MPIELPRCSLPLLIAAYHFKLAISNSLLRKTMNITPFGTRPVLFTGFSNKVSLSYSLAWKIWETQNAYSEASTTMRVFFINQLILLKLCNVGLDSPLSPNLPMSMLTDLTRTLRWQSWSCPCLKFSCICAS